MSPTDEVTLSFHGSTFLELSTRGTTVFVDPVFSSSRRGRRLRGATRPCDYVLVSQQGDNFDDVLDVLEDSEAVLVSSERVCREAQSELGLARGRVLDLEPWERASDDAFRLTAVPLTAPSLLDEGASFLEDLAGSGGPLGRLLPGGMPRELGSRLPFGLGGALGGGGGPSRGLRSLGSLPLLGNELLRGLRGKPALGFLFELTAGQRILHLSNGVHPTTDERDLEDIASLAQVDALLLDVGAQGVEAVVRAARVFAAPTVLLYRSQDAYARGRRAQPQPISAFLEALREDRGDKVEALHLREGDRFVLGAPEGKPKSSNDSPPRPAQAPASVAKPSLAPPPSSPSHASPPTLPAHTTHPP